MPTLVGMPATVTGRSKRRSRQYARVKAARRIQRFFRKRKGRGTQARFRVGEPLGYGNAKTTVVGGWSDTTVNTRTLYANELTQITRGPNINERTRDVVNLLGFSIKMHFTGRFTVPLYFNIAIIAPKSPDRSIAPWNTSPGSATTLADFFRNHGNVRGHAFDTNRTPIQFHNLPINTDEYEVFTRRKFYLFPNSGAGGYPVGSRVNFTKKNFYVKIKRQMRYDSISSSSCQTPIFIVWWCDRLDLAAGGLVENDVAWSQMYAVAFFKETGTF